MGTGRLIAADSSGAQNATDAIDVSVLIVSYNTREETLACLASVFEQTKQVAFEVIVVDNASHDGSAAAIAQAFPQVRLMALQENLGFASANNLAAKVARGNYLLLLNPDTIILDGAIERIKGFADKNPSAGLYGGRTFFADKTLNRDSCHGRLTPWSMFCLGVGLTSLARRSSLFNPEGLGSWKRDTVRDVDCISGCFLLISRDAWNRLGGFDLDFFMYGEDMDLCLRARQLGYQCLIYPEANLIHYGGRSEPVRADKMVRLFRAKTQLIEKHWPRHWVWFGTTMLYFSAFTRWIALSILGTIRKQCNKSGQEWRQVWEQRAGIACKVAGAD